MKKTESKINYEKFINLFPVQKTVSFKLIPDPTTQYWIDKHNLVVNETEFSKKAKELEKYITEFYKKYISLTLSNADIEYVTNIISAYIETGIYVNAKGKEYVDDIGKRRDAYKTMVLDLSQSIASIFDIKGTFGSPKNTLEKMYAEAEGEEKALIEEMLPFSAYFTDFCTIRNFILSGDGKSGTVAKRIVEVAEQVVNNHIIWESYPDDLKEKIACDTEFFHDAINHPSVMKFTQDNIDVYNTLLSGVAYEDGSKIKGINECVNIYNMINRSKDGFKSLPMMVKLKKIPLLDSATKSFVLSSIESDQDCIDLAVSTLDTVYNEDNLKMLTVSDKVPTMLEDKSDSIFIKKSDLNNLSNSAFGDWKVVTKAISDKYDAEIRNMSNKPEKQEKFKEKWMLDHSSFSLEFILDALRVYGGGDVYANKLLDIIYSNIRYSILNFIDEYENGIEDIKITYPKSSKLQQDRTIIELLKRLLDPVVEVQRTFNIFQLDDNIDGDTDASFYGYIDDTLSILKDAVKNYNKIRNYCVKKVDNTGKVKCMFGNPNFGTGLSESVVGTKCAAIMKRGDNYYLLVTPKYLDANGKKKPSVLPKVFNSATDDSTDSIMVYNSLPGFSKQAPRLFFGKNAPEVYGASSRVMDLYEMFKNKKNIENWDFAIEREIIEYYISAIKQHAIYGKYHYKFKTPEEYGRLSNFYKDMDRQSYSLEFLTVENIDPYINSGDIYMFQIYSRHLCGTSGKNGHTSLYTEYFKELFSEENAKNVVYKLASMVDVFYRPRKIKLEDTIIHPAGVPIPYKTKDGSRVFAYDIIKDRRYTQEQYEAHFCIQMNPNAETTGNINKLVFEELLYSDKDYNVLSIDRGEQNLIYMTVVNSRTLEVLEQRSLNVINNNDYRKKIASKAAEMSNDKSLKWKYDNEIKDIKTGYLVQCVNEVIKTMFKYNAIIVMEKLGKEFKNSRKYIGYDVYSGFEKALIDKLNFYVDKHRSNEELASKRLPLQLTNKFESFDKLGNQSGIIFYIDPSYTSRIDPLTGYVDRFGSFKYETISSTINFINKINFIEYNEEYDRYEIGICVKDFIPYASENECWTLKIAKGLNDERIELAKDMNRGGKLFSRDVNLFDEWDKFIKENGIDRSDDILSKIKAMDKSKKFCIEFLRLFKLSAQLRNISVSEDNGYVLSPVYTEDAEPFDSRDNIMSTWLPNCPDANDAYGIAIKAVQLINMMIDNGDQKINRDMYKTLNVSEYLMNINR